MALLNDLLIDETLDHISRVHIDGNDRDNLGTDLRGELRPGTNNELRDTLPDQGEELLHG